MLSTMHYARMFLLLKKLVMSGSMAGKGQSRTEGDLWPTGGCKGLRRQGPWPVVLPHLFFSSFTELESSRNTIWSFIHSFIP